MTTHTPKGSMCLACTHANEDCSALLFDTMPVMSRHPDLGQVIVRCTRFEASNKRTEENKT
jgi:hypothetical protein